MSENPVRLLRAVGESSVGTLARPGVAPADDDHGAPTGTSPPQGLASLLFMLASDPRSAFRRLNKVPLLIPLAASQTIISVLLAAASLSRAKAYSLFTATQAGKEMTSGQEYSLLYFVTIATMAAGVLAPLVVWLIRSAIVALVGLAARHRARFRAIFAVVVLAYVPSTLGDMVRALLVNLRPAEEFARVQTGLLFLVPAAVKGSALYSVFGFLDPYALWDAALLAVGLAELHGVRLRWTASLVALGWVALSALRLLF